MEQGWYFAPYMLAAYSIYRPNISYLPNPISYLHHKWSQFNRKTSILNRFLFKKYEIIYKPTVEDLFSKNFDLGSIEVKVIRLKFIAHLPWNGSSICLFSLFVFLSPLSLFCLQIHSSSVTVYLLNLQTMQRHYAVSQLYLSTLTRLSFTNPFAWCQQTVHKMLGWLSWHLRIDAISCHEKALNNNR